MVLPLLEDSVIAEKYIISSNLALGSYWSVAYCDANQTGAGDVIFVRAP